MEQLAHLAGGLRPHFFENETLDFQCVRALSYQLYAGASCGRSLSCASLSGGISMVTGTSQGRDVSRGAAQGAASGTFFLTFFGAYWGFTSAVFLSGTFQILSFLLVGLVTLTFFGNGVMLLRQVRAFPKEPSREDGARGRSIMRWFSIIFGLEIVLIALASILLSIFPLSRFIAPSTALIVGMHFIPLARLFRVSVGYVTGALLCLLALIALVALLSGVPLAGSSPYNWSLFVGLGATLMIWVTDLFMIWYGWKRVHQRGEEN